MKMVMPYLFRINIKTFFKSQFSSLFSTGVDFFVTFFLTDIFNVWYVISTILGTMSGGVTNYLLGRLWVFENNREKQIYQIFRYSLVWIGSLCLNTLGVYFLTSYLGINYKISKIFTSVSVGIFFNYKLQNSFVFKT